MNFFIQFSVLGREACSQHDCGRPALRVLGVLQAPRMCRTPARTFPLPLTGLCLDTPRVLPHTVIDSPKDVELLSENCNGPGPTGTRGSPASSPASDWHRLGLDLDGSIFKSSSWGVGRILTGTCAAFRPPSPAGRALPELRGKAGSAPHSRAYGGQRPAAVTSRSVGEHVAHLSADSGWSGGREWWPATGTRGNPLKRSFEAASSSDLDVFTQGALMGTCCAPRAV